MRVPALLFPIACFLAGLGVFAVLSGGGGAPASGSGAGAGAAGDTARAPRSTDERIAALQSAIRAGQGTPLPYAPLGLAYLQKVRETGDPDFYRRAEGALSQAVSRRPDDPEAVAGTAQLQLGRHEFRAALRTSRRALELAPGRLLAYPLLVDALMELGRYDEAARTLQRMIDLRPALASYSRVSYFRELHGDVGGAVAAMRLAVSAGGGNSENLAYVQALLGTLELNRGRLPAAEGSYRAALRNVPDYAPAVAGLARLDAARGRPGRGISRLRGLVDRLPLPEYVIALGEAELAAGREASARETFELVRVQQRLVQSRGVNTDVELALFEADHGDPRRGLELARRAWRAAPSVRAADALGWALTRAGRPADGRRFARRALALGWRDPTVLFHAGMAARAAGRRTEARRLLARALRQSPRFSALRAPQARRALAGLR